MRLEEIRVQRAPFAERRPGLRVPLERAQHEAAAVAHVGLLRGERRRALDMGEGGCRVAGAQGHDGEEMPRARSFGVAREEFAARRLRLLEPAGRLLGM